MSEEYDADQIIAKREALAACPPGHADRGDLAGTLSYALCVYYRQTLDIALITEAIGVGREALALRPPGHPERVLSCGNLAHALLAYYDYTNDAALLDEAIALDREALGLRPHDHPERSTACANLASSLRTRYQQTEDIALLDEVISLEREALGLRPAGHPSRVYSCGNLATSLHIKHRRSQDIALLDEAIKLYREALALRAVGHPDRGVTCANLAVSLQTFYQRTGDTTHLDEAIELEREALHLCPHNHPFRALSCENLAGSLYTRYQQTGDTTLLDESIGLEREALAARPKDHPDHPRGCIHLADSLHRRYRQTGEAALLDEAIDLSREALSLRPQGHLERAYCCTNLANTLMTRFRQTGEAALLDELVALEREGLALRPLDDPARVGALESLASSLCTYCQQTGNVTLLDEVADLCNEAQQQDSSAYVWRPWITMCRLHLIRNSPHHSVMKAAQCLLQSFQSQVVDDTQLYMSNISRSLPLFWASFDVWTFQTTILLISIYTNVIDRLPLIAGFVLDPSTQLKTLKAFSQVGSDACVIGLLADLSTTAVELLDCAHGVVWAQALNQRNPDMEGAPPELTGALKKALHGIVIPTSATQGEPTNSYLTSQDVRHAQNGRVQTILREIRALPGHQHFMLRKTYETLREAAREHPVVLLVTSRGHSFALVMANAHEEQPHMLRLSLTSEDLTSLGNSAEQAGLCSRADTRDSNSGTRLGLQARETHLNSKPLRVLTDIWHKIVKPVIVHLRLEVCRLGFRKT
jgi:tetratricopeptide (TPR) repeat protein